jgi:NADPH:quinone reductase-like Zn-dependent oxidoreductase
MLSTRLFGVGDIRTVEVPIPEPGPGEVLIKVEAAGICGTDRHLYLGEFPSTPGKTLGHEFSGIVVGRGKGVEIAEGTRVATSGAANAINAGAVVSIFASTTSRPASAAMAALPSTARFLPGKPAFCRPISIRFMAHSANHCPAPSMAWTSAQQNQASACS